MKFIIPALAAIMLTGTFIACNDSSTIGNELFDESIILVTDDSFTITGQTLRNPVVQSRTISQLIGNINAQGFGKINSDFVAQFMPSINIDTTDVSVEQIDSIALFMQMARDAFVGDSLVPMGVEVYPLTKTLPYPMYSDFDPREYYDPNNSYGSQVYLASTMNEPDSIREQTNIFISMRLPDQLGRDLYTTYREHPEWYNDPETFINNVYKGIYVRSSFGTGRISDFTLTSLRLYYHKPVYNEDSLQYYDTNFAGDYFVVTPEVAVNNNIKYSPAPELQQMIADGSQVLAAPAGYEVELKFPALDVINSYNKYANDIRVLNTLSLTIPADSIANDNAIGPPPYALLVLKSKKDEFFASNSLADNVTSFYATYDAVNSCYTFSGLRSYLNYLLNKDQITEDDYTFVLTPVQVDFELTANSYSYYYYYTQSSIESAIVPYVSKPVMTKISLDKAKISLTYSVATDKNL